MSLLKQLRIPLSLVLVFLFGLFLTQKSYAVDYSSIQTKWMYTQYYQCLKSNAGTKSELTDMRSSSKILSSVFLSSQSMQLPSYNLSGTNAVSCYGIVAGNPNLTGSLSDGVLSSYKNLTWGGDKQAAENFMTNVLKYEKIVNETNTAEFSINATKTVVFCPGSFGSCNDPKESKATAMTIKVTRFPNGYISYASNGSILTDWLKDIHIKRITNSANPQSPDVLKITYSGFTGCRVSYGEREKLITLPQDNSIEDILNSIRNQLENTSVSFACDGQSNHNTSTTRTTFSFGMDGEDIVNYSDAAGYKKNNNTAKSSLSIVSNRWMGSSGNNGMILNPTEYYNLYTYYLSKTAERYGGTLNALTCNPSSTNHLTPVKLIGKDGTSQQCYINFNGQTPESIQIYTQESSGGEVSIVQKTMQDVIDWLNNANPSVINLEDINSSADIDTGTTTLPGSNPGSSADSTQTCYTAAGPLGWIMCAVTDAIGHAATYLYGEIIQPFLEIDAGNILNRNSGVYSGWSTFRNVANVVFVILFIIVILAQVTGLGVSNYNVKKILPRLIMVAILVNISFIICQLAVDMSNILGNALKAAFDGLPVNENTVIAGSGSIEAVTNKSGFAGIAEGVLAILAQGGLIGAGILAFGTVQLWLPTFLLTVIGCIVSIIFFFIILAVRQAGVIILVVLAPVAIVCYALPNTKSFFDRWKKMFSALLMVYPICGLMIGGGNYASALLLSTNTGFFYVLAAMLLSVVPFFMIPSILKSSMAMMGNLGMKISNFGRGIGQKTAGTVRGSEAFKNYQRQNQFKYDAKKANRLYDRIQKLEDGKTGDQLEAVRKKHQGLYRRHALHDASARRIQAEDARAYAQTSAGKIDLNGDRNMLNEARQAALVTETKNARANYESGTAYVTGADGKAVTDSNGKKIPIRANDINALGTEYLNRLNQLQADPTSRSALTSVRALQDMMMESDAGRTMIKNKQLEHALQHRSDYADASKDKSQMALTQASEHLLSSQHQGNIKSHNRSTWSMEQAFNRGDYSQLFGSNGITALDKDGNVISQGASTAIAGYGIGAYEQQGLDGYDESSLVGADEGALMSMNRALQDMSSLDPSQASTPQAEEQIKNQLKQKAAITSLAGSAYGKESLSTQGKVAEQLRKMIINGNTASTIASTDVKALNKLAGDIGQETLTGDDRQALVDLAQKALTNNTVKDAEHAAALNNILTAAGQQTIAWNGRINTNGQGGSSGPIPVRGAGSPPDIIITGDLSGEAIRNLANQNRQNNSGSGGRR